MFFTYLFYTTISIGVIFGVYKLFLLLKTLYEKKTIFIYNITDNSVRKCVKCDNKQRKFEGYKGVEWNTFKKNPNCACRKYVV